VTLLKGLSGETSPLCCVRWDIPVVLCPVRHSRCVVSGEISPLCCVRWDIPVVLCPVRHPRCVVSGEISPLCCVRWDIPVALYKILNTNTVKHNLKYSYYYEVLRSLS
jgi:hypothetical protein